MRLAKKLTGRTEVISFWNSIHGRTNLSAALSGVPRRKAGYGPLTPGGVFFPYPNCAACPMGKEKCEGEFSCLKLADTIYQQTSAQDVAAIIVEPCQGNGLIFPPAGYLKQLESWARERGILVIVDEIQCGMGHSGQMYLYQQEELEPDMLLLGKALGNGLHIAAMLTRQLPEKGDLRVFAGGSGDDPLACRAACEVFRQLEGGLLEQIAQTGELLNAGLKKLERSPLILETRGKGLLAAVEFHSSDVCRQIQKALYEKGYALGILGNVLFCKAPYVVTETQVRGLLSALEELVL